MNPFRDTIVADPWNAPHGDVLAIHQKVFETCLNGIEHVRTTHKSAGILIYGDAGSGKTHLLGRLRSRLALKLPTATDRNEALYVWVRLQTSPRMIWRTVRRTLVNDWFRPLEDARCQFDRILFHRLAQFRVAEGDLEPWYEYMLQEDPEGLRELIERITTTLNLDRNTHVAFEHLCFGRHRRDLRAWLSGDSLPEAVLDRMELTQDQEGDDDHESQAREVVVMLCRLAGNELPVVLSFDQVEALEAYPGDNDALFAFGQLVSTIHDSTTNVLIVSSVQSAFVTRLEDKAREADRDRMKSFGKSSLSPLKREEAEALIDARLKATGEVRPPEAHAQRLWPLTEAEAQQLFKPGFVTPRKLLARCAEKFDVLQHSAAEDESGLPSAESDVSEMVEAEPSAEDVVARFLDDQWQSAVDEKHKSNSPDATEEILQYALPIAVQSVDAEINIDHGEQLQDIPVIFKRGTERTGISVCTQSNMTSLAAQLKRLQDQMSRGRVDRLVIVRDHRRPVSPTAKKSQERLDELEQQGAAVVYPSVEVLAALDALRSLLSDAKSGDLACRGETVGPQTLEEWFAAHLPHDVQDFVGEIIGTSEDGTRSNSETVSIEALNAVLEQQPVVSLPDAAGQLARSVDELADTMRRHPDQFGLLGDPPKVLFRVEVVDP